MPIDVEQWRAQTGLFCASHVFLRPPRCKQPKVQADTLSLNMKFSLAVLLVTLRTGVLYASRLLHLLWLIACHTSRLLSSIVRLSCRRLRGVSVLLALCLVVVQMLLIMAGDVEENPGPPKIEVSSHLTLDDLNNVRKELIDVNSKWFDIGIMLRVGVGRLEWIRQGYEDVAVCLREMLCLWLKSADPPPTWELLACALEVVEESRLAEQLRKKYCKTAQAAGPFPLGENDVLDICRELVGVSGKWYDLGLELGLKVTHLDNIHADKQNPLICLFEILFEWLRNSTLPPTWELLACALESQVMGESRLAEQLRIKYSKTAEAAVPSLGPDDLGVVYEELISISPQWYEFGLQLKLRTGVLESVRSRWQGHDPKICLREVLLHWLKNADPPPTWEGLACALGSYTMQQNMLAHRLRRKYCEMAQAAEVQQELQVEEQLKKPEIKSFEMQIKERDEEITIAQWKKELAEASISHSRQLQTLQQELQRVRTENQQLKKKIQSGEQQAAEASVQHETQLNALQQEIHSEKQELREQIKSLEVQIKNKDKEIAQWENQSTEANTTHSRELQELREQLQLQDQELLSVHQENKELREQVEGAGRDIDLLQQDLKALERQLIADHEKQQKEHEMEQENHRSIISAFEHLHSKVHSIIQGSTPSTPMGLSTESEPLIVEIESTPRDTQCDSMARDLLSNDINFLDFHLLQDFVEERCDEDLKSEMKEYCAMLQSFRKATTIKHYIDNEKYAQRKSHCASPDFKEVTIRVVDRAWENATLEDMEQARIIVAKEMSLPPSAFRFITAEEGSVKMKFWLKTKTGRNVQDLFSDLQCMRCTVRNGVVEVNINETYYKATAADEFRLTLEQPSGNRGLLAFLCSCFQRAGHQEQPTASVLEQLVESEISALQERKSELQKKIRDFQSQLDQVIAEENRLAQGEQRSGADYNSTGDHCGGYHNLDDGNTDAIITYLVKVDVDIIENLGIVLGIRPHRLRTTNAKHMVSLWLQEVDDVKRKCHVTGGLTWETLEKAMRHETVRLTGTADTIRKEKLNC